MAVWSRAAWIGMIPFCMGKFMNAIRGFARFVWRGIVHSQPVHSLNQSLSTGATDLGNE
jgi:hypothetical protein